MVCSGLLSCSYAVSDRQDHWKDYPIFGAILLLSAVGVFFGIFCPRIQLDNIDFSHGIKGIFDVYPYFDGIVGASAPGTKFVPVFFVTVACGITSGFHSTQCTMIGRSVRHEKEGKMTFYGTMILEGMIAMIWAAAAMGLYNSGSTAGATAAVGEVAKGLLGPVGGNHRNPGSYRTSDHFRRYSTSFLPSDDCRLYSL